MRDVEIEEMIVHSERKEIQRVENGNVTTVDKTERGIRKPLDEKRINTEETNLTKS